MNIRTTLRILYLSITGILMAYIYGLFFVGGALTIFVLQITTTVAAAGLFVTLVYVGYKIRRWLSNQPELQNQSEFVIRREDKTISAQTNLSIPPSKEIIPEK